MSPIPRKLRRVHLSAPNSETQSLTIRLDSGPIGHEESIALLVSCDGLMHLMKALQAYQALHKLPIPHTLRPRGKPSLSVVSG
jgi:hypothetical protein